MQYNILWILFILFFYFYPLRRSILNSGLPYSDTFGFLIFFLLLSLFENSSTNLSSKSFWADINLGKDSILLSTNINYKLPNHNSIYFSNLVVERERGKVSCFFTPKILRGLLSIIKYLSHYITFLNRNQQLQLYL